MLTSVPEHKQCFLFSPSFTHLGFSPTKAIISLVMASWRDRKVTQRNSGWSSPEVRVFPRGEGGREAAASRETWRLTGASVNLRCAARLPYIPLMTCARLCLPLAGKLPRGQRRRSGRALVAVCAASRHAHRLYSTRTAEQGGLGAGTLRLRLDGWGFGIPTSNSFI